MPLNADGLDLAATAIQSNLLFAQLHTASAGTSGVDNLCSSSRKPVQWTSAVDGSFGLASAVLFTGGESSQTVNSVTLWDAETDGNFYGEFAVTGDTTFNSVGEYKVTAIDFTATAEDA